ncbi:MAG: Trm112 family protein [Planctomycetota bacterium]|nr:Trm112 family protein [Planctomycetota bacterium]
MIDERLLEILVCPACRTKVRLEGERLVCQNPACGLRYPIRDDIPVMLIHEAQKPEKAERRDQGPRTRDQGKET